MTEDLLVKVVVAMLAAGGVILAAWFKVALSNVHEQLKSCRRTEDYLRQEVLAYRGEVSDYTRMFVEHGMRRAGKRVDGDE